MWHHRSRHRCHSNLDLRLGQFLPSVRQGQLKLGSGQLLDPRSQMALSRFAVHPLPFETVLYSIVGVAPIKSKINAEENLR